MSTETQSQITGQRSQPACVGVTPGARGWWLWECLDCPASGTARNRHDAAAGRRKHRERKHPEKVRAEARAAS